MNRDKPASNLRRDYQVSILKKEHMHADPIRQFQEWFSVARDSQMHEPNAMSLATLDQSGRLSCRMVLLKHVDERGFVFYTNYESAKAQALESTRKAALCFWWDILERQVRVEGYVQRVSTEESDAYFDSRPRGSRIGAIASRQSSELKDHAELEQQVMDVETRYANMDHIPRPDYWGGYRVVPSMIEFWQGRPSRLHDRIAYTLDENRQWSAVRLSP